MELLGVGGMAEVFKARCTGPGGFRRTVVVKRLLPANLKHPEFVRMFVAEAKILAMVHHPNVVQVYDFGESDGCLFLVLEYVDGLSLGEAICALSAARRAMPPMVAARIVHQVCLALDHVHNLADADGVPLNVVHRDVTPSNILLSKAGGIKLLDFGVAKYRASQTRSQQGTIKGKPAYLAPETLEKGTIDRRIDLFSVGVVLHELLTLEPLFEGDTTAMTFNRVLRMPIPVPSQARQDVPAALDGIVMKALARDPAQRYQTAQEMALDLDRLLVAAGARSDAAVAFAGELAALVHPRPAQPERKTGTTIVADTKRYFTRKLRASRVGRLLFGPAKA